VFETETKPELEDVRFHLSPTSDITYHIFRVHPGANKPPIANRQPPTANRLSSSCSFIFWVNTNNKQRRMKEEQMQATKLEQRRRHGLFIFAILYTVLFVGAFFGWGPMQLLVRICLSVYLCHTSIWDIHVII
jgi:hypothetical protein